MPEPDAKPEPTLPPDESAAPRLRPLLWAVAAVALGGLIATWCGERWDDGFPLAVAAALLLALLRPLRLGFVALLDRLRTPSPRARLLIAAIAGVLAMALCYAQAVRVGRGIGPLWHDEFSYLLQSVQLAHGRLWYPQHPVADFFESFHMIVRPVYASIYWPGTALMNAPGQWLGLPPWGVPLLLYGLAVSLAYLLASRLVDGVAGLAAALLAAQVFEYDDFSTRIMAQMPTTVLALGLVLAWLRWRRAPPRRRLGWVALLGALAGWGAITRPVDAAAFALPVGVAVLGRLVLERRRNGGTSRPIWLTLAAGVLPTLPFLAVQIVQDHGTTGHVLLPPYVQYLRDNQPGTVFGEQGGVGQQQVLSRPKTTLPQKLDYYDRWLVEMSRDYNQRTALGDTFAWRLPAMLNVALPGRSFYAWGLLGVLTVLGVAGPDRLRRLCLHEGRPRAAFVVLLVVAGLFLLLYTFNPFFLPHYALPLAVVTLPLCGLGLRSLEESAGDRLRPWLICLLSGGTLLWLGWTTYNYPAGRWDVTNLLTFKHDVAPKQIQGRGLILVRYRRGGNPHEEVVYNSNVPWPDDARIVWAQDLGDRDGEILRYYADRQPDRAVYLLARPQEALIPLGRVPEALQRFEAGRWPGREAILDPPTTLP